MTWRILEHPSFAPDREAMPAAVIEKLAGVTLALGLVGPKLGRPMVDTLKGSRHANMKELRIGVVGAWRVLFAFDPERNAVLLVCGNKEGVSQKKFYKDLIRIADARFDEWIEAED